MTRVALLRRSWLRCLVAGMVLALVLLGATSIAPDRAEAHAGLESSVPAPSSVLDTSPPSISLDFDEDIDAPLTSIELFDQAGAAIDVGAPVAGADASTVESTVPPLSEGVYAVVWRVTSADGHVITGAFSFQIGTRAGVDADALIDSVSGGRSADPAVGRLLGVSRFAAFLGAVLVLGGLLMVWSIGASGVAVGWAARRLLWIGWALLVVGTAANFGLLGANAIAGSVGDAFDTAVWRRIAETRTGGLLVARLAIALVLLPVPMLTLGRRRARWWSIATLVVAVLVVLSFSASGHPSVQRTAAVWVIVDAVHLGGIIAWLGGLAMMALGGRAWLGDDGLERAVHRFSAVSTVAVPLVVVTGVLQGWRIGGGLSDLTETSWGRLLLAKGVLAVLVVTIGGASRWLLQNDGPRALRRTVLTEAALGVAVLGLAAGLVGSAPEAAAQSRIFHQSLTEAGTIADVTITPGRVGPNEVHLVVTPAGGNLSSSATVTARMTLPERDIPFVPVTIDADAPNHFTGEVILPFAGTWTLELVVAPQPSQSVLLRSEVEIPG